MRIGVVSDTHDNLRNVRRIVDRFNEAHVDRVVHEPHQLSWVDGEVHEVALHGHTHLRRIERTAGQLVFDPGESAGHMKGHNAIGILDLASLEPESVLF